MATISKRTNKSGTYYYLVESARVNGKPRIVKQVYLGTAECIEGRSFTVLGILWAEHMKAVFDYSITGEPRQTPAIPFSLSNERWNALQERELGKSILFTNHADWTTEQIISAYRSQCHAAEVFEQMKDTKTFHPGQSATSTTPTSVCTLFIVPSPTCLPACSTRNWRIWGTRSAYNTCLTCFKTQSRSYLYTLPLEGNLL